MKNLIVNAFCFEEKQLSSPQLGKVSDKNKMDIYLKNIAVSLVSAKLHNKKDDVALITNIDIPSNFRNILEENGIMIIIVPFETFVFPVRFRWSMAFYKLCALKFIVNNLEYDNYLLIDTDTITINSFFDIWKESQAGILLYDLHHNYSHNTRAVLRKDYFHLFKKKHDINHFGGEFICGNKIDLKEFINECLSLYNSVKSQNFPVDISWGDEHLISICSITSSNIISGNSYIARYWTGKFYYVSTNYIFDAVSILHIPNEKNHGLIRIYDFYIKKGRIPNIKNIAFLLGLPQARRPFNISTFNYYFNTMKQKIGVYFSNRAIS